MTSLASKAAAVGGALLFMPVWASAQAPTEPYRYGYGSHMMDWGGGWLGMIFGPLLMILVLVAVIVIAVLLVRWLGGASYGAPPAPPARTPLDILKERFARGEIDKEEFEDRRRLLGD